MDMSRYGLFLVTQSGGRKAYNDVMHLIEFYDGRVTLDFSNVSLVGASWAFEVFGRLVVQMGRERMSDLVDVVGMSPINQFVVRCVMCRAENNILDLVGA